MPGICDEISVMEHEVHRKYISLRQNTKDQNKMTNIQLVKCHITSTGL